MFVLRRMYSRTSGTAKYLKPAKLNPGIHHRKQAIKVPTEDNEDLDFEQMESDFMSIDKTHQQHVQEIYAMKEKEKYLIVRQKYFKEQYPNFLTWHDKEHIRYLHNSDSEEWNVEKLAEGFPALPEIIMKIVKGKWIKKSINKIQNHDKSVLQNWKDLKDGKLDHLPGDLKKHLQKFTDRTINLQPFDYNTLNKEKAVVQQNARIQGEFSEIISSYEQLKNKNKINTYNTSGKLSVSDETFKLEPNSKNKSDKNLVTLKELQTRLEEKAEKGGEISVEEKLIIKTAVKDKQTSVMDVGGENVSEIIENKHKTGEQVGFVKKTTRDVSHLIYPEQITIPKNIYKKGCTYKLNDCYYDSDGEFLYRVPGMD